MELVVRELEGEAFGAEVRGWDPGEDLDDETRRRIDSALAEHILLVFRGHRQPNDQELISFAARFGDLFDGGELFGMDSPTTEILQLTSERDGQGVETGPSAVTPLPWHTDYSYLVRGAKMSFLNALHLPPDGGGETWFANLYDAYETLPEQTRERISGLVGIHRLGASGQFMSREEKDQIKATREARSPQFGYPGHRIPGLHPAVYAHPDTGRRSLYVNALVSGFEGIDEPTGRSLVAELYHHACQEQRIYKHHWSVGDLVLFDTVGTMHRRDGTDETQTRVMRQMSTLLPALV